MKITKNNMIVGAAGIGIGVGVTAVIVKVAEDKNRKEIVKLKHVMKEFKKDINQGERNYEVTGEKVKGLNKNVDFLTHRIEELLTEIYRMGLGQMEIIAKTKIDDIINEVRLTANSKVVDLLEVAVNGQMEKNMEKMMTEKLKDSLSYIKLQQDSISDRIDECADLIEETQKFINTTFGEEAVDLVLGTKQMLEKGEVLNPVEKEKVEALKDEAADYIVNGLKEVAIEEDTDDRPKKKAKVKTKTKNNKPKKTNKTKKEK